MKYKKFVTYLRFLRRGFVVLYVLSAVACFGYYLSLAACGFDYGSVAAYQNAMTKITVILMFLPIALVDVILRICALPAFCEDPEERKRWIIGTVCTPFIYLALRFMCMLSFMIWASNA